jgi:purine-binding chemotaxis protein CheW
MTIQIDKNKFQVMHFLVQNVHLCFDIQYIVKVIPLIEIKPVPGSPSYLAGLINVAGKSVPVIDLALRLGLKRTEDYTTATPMIICNDDSNEVGLIVDEILGLTIVDKSTLQMKNNFTDPESLFSAVVSIDARLALVLNMQQILSLHYIPENNNEQRDNTVNLAGFKYE